MNKSFNKHKNQSGLVLVVVLILVPIIFMVSYTSINKLTVGERSTGNVIDRSHAFYAAETAIAAAELWMKSGEAPFVSAFQETAFSGDSDTFSGLLYKNEKTIDQALSSTAEDVVEYDKYLPDDSGFLSSDVLDDLDRKPVYVIEMIDFSPCVDGMEQTQGSFKVTARGWGIQAATMVTLETFFSLTFKCGVVNGR